MTKYKNEAQLYLEMYPNLKKKWINQCIICQREGYKLSLPENIHPGIAAQNIRKYFEPLDIDENGLCDLCSKVVK